MISSIVTPFTASLRFYLQNFLHCMLPAAVWLIYEGAVIQLLEVIYRILSGRDILVTPLTFVTATAPGPGPWHIPFPLNPSLVALVATLLLIPALISTIKRLSELIVAQRTQWSLPQTAQTVAIAYGYYLILGCIRPLFTIAYFTYYFTIDYEGSTVRLWNSCLFTTVYLCMLSSLVQRRLPLPPKAPTSQATNFNLKPLIRTLIVLITTGMLFVSGLTIGTVVTRYFTPIFSSVGSITVLAFTLVVMLILPLPVIWIALLDRWPRRML
jgi:hypothetical protein